MTTVAIIGSRTFDDEATIRDAVAGLAAEFGPGVEIVSGAAPGADELGVTIAREAGLATREFPPDDARDGPDAHWARNTRIAEAADLVVAFFAPGPLTPGTADTLAKARRRGIPVRVFHEGRWSDG